MNKQTIIVPKGIRYISEWNNLEEGKRLVDLLPSLDQYIMNKTITGCGYTEYCITNPFPTILCSPRLVLLENKEDQHKDMENLLYLRNDFEFNEYDRDISKDDLRPIEESLEKIEERKKLAEEHTKILKERIRKHIELCYFKLHKSPKFLVTYDSFRRIKEELGESINNYLVVVDEFQSIFCDSRFKSDTENEFLNCLHGIKNVCYLSATPMMDKYLDMLPEFKDLPYYELDWSTEDSNRVIKPYLKTKQVKRSLVTEVCKIIDTYKDGKFEKLTRQLEDGTFEEVYSKEAVIYVNSVKNICDIIRRGNLSLNNTNVLCSNDAENEKKIKDAFKKAGDTTITNETKCIGKVPKEGDIHKMFTLCTRTVYLGADFYSTNARSFIFSDANVDCLSVDITLDLPQILGRQRLKENPWKNRAELYFKLNAKEKSQEEFDMYLDEKKRMTESLLKAYQDTTEKHNLTVVYQERAKTKKYKDDFVSVNKHSGSDKRPVFNNLVMVSEMRAFEIQQVDYKDRFSVFSAISKEVSDIEDVNLCLDTLYGITNLADRYKYFCSLEESMINSILPHLPESFTNYYTVLGKSRMIALGYNATNMKKEYDSIIGNQNIDIKNTIISSFSINEKLSKKDIINRLEALYNSIGYSKTPKAIDIKEYFEVKDCKIPRPDGTRDNGYELLSIKKE